MKYSKRPYSFFQSMSAIFMMVALFWLTISAPFVFAQQKEMSKQDITASSEIPLNDAEEEANPLGNTTEEKAPNSLNSFSEEYLHDNHRAEYFLSIASQFHKFENAGTYVAFHGEMLVPPPNVA